MLSGQITKATVQTMHECNQLLRFSKNNKDVGLLYNYIGHPSELQLVTFFDAGFASRTDGNSQGGYISTLMNKKLVTSPEEGEYHVVNWRSFRTPRVARSSLAAEAQSGGQAADAVDFTCRYWEHLMDPKVTLKNLIQMPSSLKPILVTDAKALYDSFHREGINSSVIDKRVSLEIRVMKERVTELNGSLRWMSSDRQIADGLTKTSARVLLSARLRHGRLKMTWDPTYQAAKRKTKGQRAAAIAESTPEAHVQKNMDTSETSTFERPKTCLNPLKPMRTWTCHRMSTTQRMNTPHSMRLWQSPLSMCFSQATSQAARTMSSTVA